MDAAVIQAILKSTLPAGFLALLAFALLWRRRRALAAPAPRWPGPVILAAAALLTHYLLYLTLLPGAPSASWYPAVILAALTLGLLDGTPTPFVIRLALQTAALAAIAWLFTRNLPASALAANAAFVVLSLVIITALSRLAHTTRGFAPPLLAWAFASAVALFAMLVRSSQFDAYPAMTLAAVAGAATLVALWRPALSLAGGTLTTLAVIACANIYRAQTLGDGLPWHSAVVLPLLALTAIAPCATPKRPALGIAAGLLGALAALLACFILAPPPAE
jgi:hypothetical protein